METALTGPSIIVAVIIIIIRNDIIIMLFLLKTIMSPVMVFSRQTTLGVFFPCSHR